jgi:predicted dehydrogenase
MINLGMVGFGYWGRNLAREFSQLSDVTIKSICDKSTHSLKLAHQHFPQVPLTQDAKDIIHDPHIDAVLIATPIHTHYDLALQVLMAGKHVLVEKPLTIHLKDALCLQEIAEQKQVVAMTDYTPIYSSASRTLHDLVISNDLGKILYFDSIRTNFGSNDLHSSVIWDLAVHDFALIDYLMNAKPIAISATAGHFIKHDVASLAYLTLFFDNDAIAHVYVNSVAPEKLRHIVLGGNNKIAVYDDCLTEGKLKLFDFGVGDMTNKSQYLEAKSHATEMTHHITVGHNDGLSNMAKHFIDCINAKQEPQTNCAVSVKLIHMLESAEKSLHHHGEEIKFNAAYI